MVLRRSGDTYMLPMKSFRRIEIRPAVPDDLMMIASVLVSTWRATFRGIIADAYLDAMTVEDQAIRHARRMRFPGSFMMAAADMAEGRVIGFANYGKARGMPPAFDRELYELYLLPEFHGAGLGSALVRSVAAHCRETGGHVALCLGAERQPQQGLLRAARCPRGGRGPGRRRQRKPGSGCLSLG